MSQLVESITDSQFNDRVLQSSKPVLVDFWAAWCSPCKAIAPIVDELASKYEGKVEFKKIDIDQNPSTPVQYGVRGIPTLILFKNGQIVDQVVGATSKEHLSQVIDKAI